MKQETIEQLMKIAGKHEYSQTLILSVSQVQTMLEAAYEAGQRDGQSYPFEPEGEE